MNRKNLSLTNQDHKKNFLQTRTSKVLIAANALSAMTYFVILAVYFPPSNPYLFGLLIISEIFHVWQTLTFLYTIWETDKKPKLFDRMFTPAVDVFITVAGEPAELVEQTIRAAKNLDYPDFSIHVLNDGLVAKKDNWREIIALCEKLKVNCITRRIPGGAKAGNINNGLRRTTKPFVVNFDADHIPHKDFLKKTIGYFVDEKMGFVQTPQYYRNHQENLVTEAAWDQQALFFGPILKGKNRLNSVTMCGTNMVIRRSALMEVNGICEDNIAEDFLTGLFLHQRGWKSVYVPEVLAEGLAPEDLLSYTKQQFRWARGSLEVVFKFNPLFNRRLSWPQRIQYLSSASFFLSGTIVLLNAIFPLLFFFFGFVPMEVSSMALAATFLPYIFLTVLLLRISSNRLFSFRALSFGMSGFLIHLSSLFTVLTGKRSAFDITPKKKVSGNFLPLVIPHLGYIALTAGGFVFAFFREGLSVSVITNLSWAIFNVAVFVPFITAAFPQTEKKSRPIKIKVNDRVYAE